MTDFEPFSDELLEGLTPEQREAVTSKERRLLVRATAGSGKTHVLTLRIQRRIQLGEVDADQVLAMTFTKKAGEELKKRLWRAGIRDVRAGTFHSAANAIVAQYRMDHHLRPLTIEPNRRRLVSQLATQLREDNFALQDWQLPRFDQEISWALTQGFDGAAYAKAARKAKRDAPLPPMQMAEAIDRYIAHCRSRGVIDFDLLLSEAITILQSDANTLASFRYRTKALFVDESQDMNPLQFLLLKVMAGEDPDIFFVGDPNQSIYGFNGANPRLLDEIIVTWPDTVVLDLTRNHRSTANIIDVASTMLESGAKGIEPAREGGDVPLVRGYDTDGEEALHVARWLTAQHKPGTPWRAMAVLARTNAQLDEVAAVFEHEGVPFERRGPEHSPGIEVADSTAKSRRAVEEVTTDAVALSTIHRSKGLEFQYVATVGWAEGQLPIFNATTPGDIAEEQRLAYVALSRAEHSLLITWSRGKNDTRFPDRQPSRFLAPIEAALAQIAVRNAPVTGDARKSRLAQIRAELESQEVTE